MKSKEWIEETVALARENVWQQLQRQRPSMGQEAYKRALYKYSPHSFLCFVEAVCGERFEIRDFHIVIAAVLERLAFSPVEQYKRLMLSAPPRSGKSTIVQLFTAWLTGLNPRVGNMFASYGQRLSSKFMSKIHGFVNQPEFGLCFPSFPGFVQGSKSELVGGGYFTATSVGGASTGFDAGTLDLPRFINEARARHRPGEVLPGTPGLLTVDDPLKAGSSEAELEALDSWWTDEYNTRRTGNWIQLLIATRFSLRDLHAKLLMWDGEWDSETNPTGWLCLNITALREPMDVWDPVGRGAEDEPLWPGHITLCLSELLQLRAKNPRRFGALYQGNPVVSETGEIKAKDLRSEEEGEPEIVYSILAVDCSTGLSPLCDNTGFVHVGICTQGLPWVLFSHREVVNFVDLRAWVKEYLSRETVSEIVVELSSNGVALYQELTITPERYDWGGETTGYLPRLYGSKEKRLGSVVDLIKLLRWRGKHGALRKELLDFPFGAEDDLVDALVWGLVAIRVELENFEVEPEEGGQPEALEGFY